MTRCLLVRHGTVDWEAVGGRGLPAPLQELAGLSPAGVAQLRELAGKLAARGPKLVVTSPLTRALHSAHLLATGLRLPLEVRFDLREWVADHSFGWTTYAEVEAAISEMLDGRGEWPEATVRPWEPLTRVRERATCALADYRDRDCVAVVTHNVVIYALTGQNLPAAGWVEHDLETLLTVRPDWRGPHEEWNPA